MITNVIKAAIFNGNRVLVLIKGQRHRHPEHDLFDLPGGKIKYAEDPFAALLREVWEETGLVVEPIAPIRLWSFIRSDGRHFLGATIACTSTSTDVILSEEHHAYDWLAPTELPDTWPISAELIAAFEILELLAGVSGTTRRLQSSSGRDIQ